MNNSPNTDTFPWAWLCGSESDMMTVDRTQNNAVKERCLCRFTDLDPLLSDEDWLRAVSIFRYFWAGNGRFLDVAVWHNAGGGVGRDQNKEGTIITVIYGGL